LSSLPFLPEPPKKQKPKLTQKKARRRKLVVYKYLRSGLGKRLRKYSSSLMSHLLRSFR
jgi:hypothetical protein